MERFIVISGCSSGGKSTLVAELRRRGHAAVEEPGRRIVKEEMKGDGPRFPGQMKWLSRVEPWRWLYPTSGRPLHWTAGCSLIDLGSTLQARLSI